MEKVLNTTDDVSIIKSLSAILSLPAADIWRYITINSRTICNLTNFNDVDIDHFFNFVLKQKKLDELRFEEYSFDQITLSHLTTRINSDNLLSQPLYNLFDALIRETELSCFLKNKGLEFEETRGKLRTYYNGSLINWEDYRRGNESVVGMILRRFEGSKSLGIDKCVNGFLFGGELHKHSDVRHLIYGPEIIQNVCTVLQRIDILKSWRDHCKTYLIVFKANVSDSLFDNAPNLNYKQKVFRIYREVIYYLGKRFYAQWQEDDNPMVRLKDKLNVSSSSILSAKVI